ncbi:choline dehydrogenase [Aureimonas jatrophae]|uniref:Choline dehydrogenase n=1 Tax=Aureimonas jatrophae TaxID=1166073 RepID=A0A1H0KNM2_9HYPH|nr:choline dehydrogenase [Aureimonas jatrophae]MBB3948796.1 choline dehydrogenase [Aureimonas jatrophae]SDO57406.1 choline dehydrogenase [Aureimonas jatrophae]
MEIETFDYVVVGAGSAGCVLANRLSEDGRSTVLLLEFGGSDRSVLIQMPSALSIPMNMRKYNWGYSSEPEPNLGGRRMNVPRGKVLGGSSSINGMVYVRGAPADFDRWEHEGARGWSYARVLPYFRRAENRQSGGDEYRGGEGALHTSYGTLENPLYQAFVEAAAQAGHPTNLDINGGSQEGFGRMDMTVHKGRRWSTANAYLRPALSRPNLVVRTGALVERVVLEGRRAAGVAYRVGAQAHLARASREVVLSAGSINSPKLLKLSGIGPAEELRAHGIAVAHDLPGVGENLQDHLEFYFQVACREPITLFRSTGAIAKGQIGARWLLTKRGLGATNHFESCGFIRSSPDVPYPDIQYHFLPLAVTYDGKGLASEHSFQAHVGPLRSKSKGHVRLASSDPAAAPRILFNYMSHPDDWREMRACVRLTREIFRQPAFDRYRGREIAPGEGVQSDAEIDAFVERHVESALHPSCTCRMGDPADPMSVVDEAGRVVGVDALRVVDSSIMPSITSGNLNAPTIMLAEKLSDAIRGLEPLAAADVPYQRVRFDAADPLALPAGS